MGYSFNVTREKINSHLDSTVMAEVPEEHITIPKFTIKVLGRDTKLDDFILSATKDLSFGKEVYC